jgi:Family of unknown function (DUF6056)
MSQKKIFFSILATCNIVFLIYYLIIGYYNQPALDDYCVIGAQNYWGFNSPISYWYRFWNGRFLPLYLCNIFLTLFTKTNTTIWFTVFLMIGFNFSIYRILSILSKKYLKQTVVEPLILLNISAFIFHVFIYNNFKFNTFFWLNASTMYFGGIMFLLIGIGEVISDKKRWYSYPLVIFSFLYAGCSTENHALVMAVFLFGLIAVKLFFKQKVNFNLNLKYYIGSVSLLISFLLLVSAPGSQHRIVDDSVHMAKSSQFDIILTFFQNFALKYIQLTFEIGLLYLPFAILLIPIFISIFSFIFPKNLVETNAKPFKIWPFFITVSLLIGAAIAPTVFIFGNLGPQRILTIVNAVLLTLLIISTLFYILKHKNLNSKLVNQLSFAALVLIIFQVGFRIYTEIPVLQEYANFENKKRNEMAQFEGKTNQFQYQNPPELIAPTLSENISMYLLRKFKPENVETWGKIVKHEPVLPNTIDKFDTKIYEECYGVAFGKKIKIDL